MQFNKRRFKILVSYDEPSGLSPASAASPSAPGFFLRVIIPLKLAWILTAAFSTSGSFRSISTSSSSAGLAGGGGSSFFGSG